MTPIRTIIMGAAGRDFHNFNVFFRDNPDYRGGGLHRDPDPEHRRPHLSGRTGRVSSIPKASRSTPESDLVKLDPRNEGRPGHLCLQRCAARSGDAQGLDRAGCRRRFPPDGHQDHPDQIHQAGGLGLRRAHRLRQEPDHPPRLADPARDGLQSGRHPPPHALRRPGQAGRAALCHLRRPGQARVHHRGARGIRTAPGQRRDRLRRRGLRSASCARPNRKWISSCGTAATTISPSTVPTCRSWWPTRTAPGTR